MEDKTIIDRESQKKDVGDKSTDRDWSKEISSHSAGSQMTLNEPAGFGRGTDSIEEELDTETGQGPESYSDEGRMMHRM